LDEIIKSGVGRTNVGRDYAVAPKGSYWRELPECKKAEKKPKVMKPKMMKKPKVKVKSELKVEKVKPEPTSWQNFMKYFKARVLPRSGVTKFDGAAPSFGETTKLAGKLWKKGMSGQMKAYWEGPYIPRGKLCVFAVSLLIALVCVLFQVKRMLKLSWPCGS
jgi:hypothetical protein